MLGVLRKLFGSKHEKDVKALQPLVEAINEYYSQYKSLSDDELRAKTTEFRNRIHDSIKDVEAEIEQLKPQLVDLEGVRATSVR